MNKEEFLAKLTTMEKKYAWISQRSVAFDRFCRDNLTDELKNDPQVVSRLILSHPLGFNHIGDTFKQKDNFDTLINWYAEKLHGYISDKSIGIPYFAQIVNEISSKEIILAVMDKLKNHADLSVSYLYASTERFRNDEDVALESIIEVHTGDLRSVDMVFQCVPDKLKQDPIFLEKCVQKNILSLRYFPSETIRAHYQLRGNDALIKLLVEKEPERLKDFPEVSDNEAVVSTAVSIDPLVIANASKRLQKDSRILEAAIGAMERGMQLGAQQQENMKKYSKMYSKLKRQYKKSKAKEEKANKPRTGLASFFKKLFDRPKRDNGKLQRGYQSVLQSDLSQGLEENKEKTQEIVDRKNEQIAQDAEIMKEAGPNISDKSGEDFDRIVAARKEGAPEKAGKTQGDIEITEEFDRTIEEMKNNAREAIDRKNEQIAEDAEILKEAGRNISGEEFDRIVAARKEEAQAKAGKTQGDTEITKEFDSIEQAEQKNDSESPKKDEDKEEQVVVEKNEEVVSLDYHQIEEECRKIEMEVKTNPEEFMEQVAKDKEEEKKAHQETKTVQKEMAKAKNKKSRKAGGLYDDLTQDNQFVYDYLMSKKFTSILKKMTPQQEEYMKELYKETYETLKGVDPKEYTLEDMKVIAIYSKLEKKKVNNSQESSKKAYSNDEQLFDDLNKKADISVEEAKEWKKKKEEKKVSAGR